jgi:hypothetical protein
MMTNPESAPIKRDDIDTARGEDSSDGQTWEAPMIAAGQLPNGQSSSPVVGLPGRYGQRYVPPMTSSITVAIDAVEARRPGLSDTKRNLLLYFCQGHHLAHSGDALFAEALYATDNGVDVDEPGDLPAGEPLTNGQLNTIGDVLSRYGNLSPADLRTLVQASVPWQLAIKSTLGPRIEWAWLRDWFRRPDETEDPEDDRPTQSKIAAWRARSATR